MEEARPKLRIIDGGEQKEGSNPKPAREDVAAKGSDGEVEQMLIGFLRALRNESVAHPRNDFSEEQIFDHDKILRSAQG